MFLDHEVASFAPGSPDQSGSAHSVVSVRGETVFADLVVGADGGRSIVRKEFEDHQPPRVLPDVGWRGLPNGVPSDWKNGRISESWGGGSRFGIAPVSEGRTYWYATENTDSGIKLSREKWKAHLLDRFRQWHAPICDLIDATDERDILLSGICESLPLRSWSRGTLTLLGDAAHLMTPNLGQGAAMALEDAWVLAKSLQASGCNPTALNNYDRIRKYRASFVVWQSRQVGKVIQLEHPVLTAMRNGSLRLMPDWIGARALSPIFNFRA